MYKVIFFSTLIIICIFCNSCTADFKTNEKDSPPGLNVLIKKLYSEDLATWSDAQKKIVALGKKALPRLQKELKGMKTDKVKWRVSQTLTKIGTDSLPYIEDAYESGSALVREYAIRAALELIDVRSRRLMMKAINDKNPMVRANAAESLRHYNTPESIAHLISAIKDKHKYVKISAINSLIKFADFVPKTKLVYDSLLISAEDKIAMVRALSLTLAEKVFAEKSLAIIKKKLRDHDVMVRCVAINLLPNYVKVKSDYYAILTDLINDKDKSVREVTAIAIGRIGVRKMIPLIIKLASEEKGNLSPEVYFIALSDLTKQNFGNDVAKWREWWEKNKDRILKEEAEKGKKQ